MNLLQRLVGPGIRSDSDTRLTYAEAYDFFERLGINVNTIGFPLMNVLPSGTPLERPLITFDKLNAVPVSSGGRLKIIITGEYVAKPSRIYFKDGHLFYGYSYSKKEGAVKCRFKIEDGKLTLRGN
jgi:hypothetical protein